MKYDGIKETTVKSISYICKSVDFRPSVVYIGLKDGNRVEVKPTSGRYERPLWIPSSMLYQNDPTLFKNLQEAYIRKDHKTLERLWQQAKPWKP